MLEMYKEWKRKRFWTFYRKEKAEMEKRYNRRKRQHKEDNQFKQERFRKFHERLKVALIIPYYLVFIVTFLDFFGDYRTSCLTFATYCVFAITTYLAFIIHASKPSRRQYKERRMIERWVAKDEDGQSAAQ